MGGDGDLELIEQELLLGQGARQLATVASALSDAEWQTLFEAIGKGVGPLARTLRVDC